MSFTEWSCSLHLQQNHIYQIFFDVGLFFCSCYFSKGSLQLLLRVGFMIHCKSVFINLRDLTGLPKKLHYTETIAIIILCKWPLLRNVSVFMAFSESLVEQVLVMKVVFIVENASECTGPFISWGGLALIYWLSKSEMIESTLNHWVQQDLVSSAKGRPPKHSQLSVTGKLALLPLYCCCLK